MKLRTLLFWLHLCAGTIAGLVILTMSVTGTLLTFQQSVLQIVEGSQRRVVPPDGRSRLEADVLLDRVRAAVPGVSPTVLTLDADPAAAAMVTLGAQGVVFVNPYTGDVLGTGSARARGFYRTVTNWHRYLGMNGEGRATGRAITGACNAAFLVLAVTGLILWWPRQWSMRHVAAVIWFRRGQRGRARDFNWHNAIGFWSAPILIVLTATGMVISYTWAGNLVYRLTGSPLPSAGRGAAATGPASGNDRGRPAPARDAAAAAVSLESLVARAQQQLPTWRSMTVRLSTDGAGPVTFTMNDREHWNAFARSTLTVSRTDGRVVRWEPYAGTNLGQRVRGWMRFAHTGELGGLAGEAVAGVASAGGPVLVWTGLALALRRFRSWVRRLRETAVGSRDSGLEGSPLAARRSRLDREASPAQIEP